VGLWGGGVGVDVGGVVSPVLLVVLASGGV